MNEEKVIKLVEQLSEKLQEVILTNARLADDVAAAKDYTTRMNQLIQEITLTCNKYRGSKIASDLLIQDILDMIYTSSLAAKESLEEKLRPASSGSNLN